MILAFTVLHDPATGDIDMSQGTFRFTSDTQTYVAQRLEENLSFFLGEWFLDLRQGLPYFEKVIGQKPDFALLDTLFRRTALATPGVAVVQSLSSQFDRKTRKAGVFFNAVAKDGTLITQDDLKRPLIINY